MSTDAHTNWKIGFTLDQCFVRTTMEYLVFYGTTYNFAKEKRDIQLKNGVYYIRARAEDSQDPVPMSQLVEEREGLIQGRKCRKFDNLVQACSKIIVISGLSPEDIASAKCSCRQGMKKHLCKHVIGLGIQLGYPNWEKRPWGRPSKAKKAKIIQ